MVQQKVLRSPSKILASSHQSILDRLHAIEDNHWSHSNEHTEHLPMLL